MTMASAAMKRMAAPGLLLLAWGGPALAQTQGRVGEVVAVVRDVRGMPSGQPSRSLVVGDDLLLLMEVATGARSAVQMTFDPRGTLQLGANARVVLDREVVDAATGEPRSRVQLFLGRLRLLLSPAARRQVEIDTPTATIGVKGTDVRLAVDRRGATLVAVFEGEATVTAKAGGAPRTLTSGWLTVVEPGQGPTPPALVEPEATLQSPAPRDPAFDAPAEELSDPPVVLDLEQILAGRDFPQGPDPPRGGSGP
jgi:hypothetical protein